MPDKQRQIVLCFDGTGNTFQADGSDTNILKICRMLERTDDQCKNFSFLHLGIPMLTTRSMLLPTYDTIHQFQAAQN